MGTENKQTYFHPTERTDPQLQNSWHLLILHIRAGETLTLHLFLMLTSSPPLPAESMVKRVREL